MRKILKEKGAEIEEGKNEWNIKNHEEINLPESVIFFGKCGEEDITDAVNKYQIKSRRPTYGNRCATLMEKVESSKDLSDYLKANFPSIGYISTTRSTTEAFAAAA